MRVGLDDNLWIGKGQLAHSNAQQVAKIRRILEELGLEIATPEDTREILNLKGKNNVNFLAANATAGLEPSSHHGARGNSGILS